MNQNLGPMFHGVEVNYEGITDSHNYGNGEPMHHFTAKLNGKPAGFALYNLNGTIDTVMVPEEHQRKGVATAIWNAAKAQGLSKGHADVRTPAGDSWAKKVGGPRPKNQAE